MERIETSQYLSMSYAEKIDIMSNNPEALDLPGEASFIAQYMAEYRPALPPVHGIDNETSIDIQETLQSVALIDINTISRAMRMLGYKLAFRGVSQPTWAMRHKDDIANAE